MMTKYQIEFSNETLQSSKKRLINQIWKLIPMKENNEDWIKQLDGVIIEIVGLKEIFNSESNLLILLSKLEGLKIIEEFKLYRKVVFEIINLVDGLWLN